MDRLWSNVARSSSRGRSLDESVSAQIHIDPRLESPRKEGVGLTLGGLVPDFGADSTQGKIDWHRWIGNCLAPKLSPSQKDVTGDSWAILIGYPNDFQPVAATELAYLAQARDEFEKR